MKKVSIAVAVYNEEAHLRRCLVSLINQTYNNIEIIVVDDCSTDNSLQICYEYAKKDNRIIVIEKETHTVLSDVRNVGIDHATGEYIMFVDSDDFVCENFVEEMVRAIEEKNVDAVRCKYIYKNGDKYIPIGTQWYSDRIFEGEELRKIAKEAAISGKKQVPVTTWLFIIKLSKLKIKFNNKVYCSQDVIFFVEALLESISSLYFLDKELYYYCYHKKSITNSIDNYYRYLDSTLVLGEELKQILLRNNFCDKELDKKLAYATFSRIKHKIFSLEGISVFGLRKIIKNTLNNKRVVEVKMSYNVSQMNHKSKVYKILVTLHFYFLIAICMKISSTRAEYKRNLRGN